ncbi:hypothetical protein STEG23_018440, partial [Scotinomys teguina]
MRMSLTNNLSNFTDAQQEGDFASGFVSSKMSVHRPYPHAGGCSVPWPIVPMEGGGILMEEDHWGPSEHLGMWAYKATPRIRIDFVITQFANFVTTQLMDYVGSLVEKMLEGMPDTTAPLLQLVEPFIPLYKEDQANQKEMKFPEEDRKFSANPQTSAKAKSSWDDMRALEEDGNSDDCVNEDGSDRWSRDFREDIWNRPTSWL